MKSSPRVVIPNGLQVQAVEGYDVASDFGQAGLKLVLEVLAAHDLARFCHLSEKLFQAAEESDQGAFVGIGHFARDRHPTLDYRERVT